jgi:UDP-N-acetylmuramoyl-tripeptide--D-alanyl-D-alanine ligase
MKPIFYGIKNQDKVEIYAEKVKNLGLKGSQAELVTRQGSIEIEVLIPGRHNLYNALAAAGVGLVLGMDLEEIQHGIHQARTIGGRSNLLEAHGMVIIDDCYNANPTSMRASIDLLRQGTGRTVAVLGDMGELGADEKQLHYEVGAYAAQSKIDALFCTGNLSKEMANGAKGCEVHYFATKEEMLPALLDYLKEGDTVLVKASHFMDFAKVVERIAT